MTNLSCYHGSMERLQILARKMFYDVESRQFLVVNNFLAVLTLLSILGIILETVRSLEQLGTLFSIIEYVSVFFFTLEYLGRIIANKKDTFSYIFSFFGLIDLLAIVPTYFGLSNLTFLKSARVLRVLRLLRVVRLAKVARFNTHQKKDLEEFSHLYRLNIQIYFFALFSSIIVFGTLIYVLEASSNTAFANIPLGMIWAAKVTLGGITQELPSTPLGEIVSILARFMGLALFGLLISIVGNSIRRLVFGTAEISVNKNKK